MRAKVERLVNVRLKEICACVRKCVLKFMLLVYVCVCVCIGRLPGVDGETLKASTPCGARTV